MSKTKKVTITLTPEQQKEAKLCSARMFGRANISGYFALLHEQHKTKGNED